MYAGCRVPIGRASSSTVGCREPNAGVQGRVRNARGRELKRVRGMLTVDDGCMQKGERCCA